MTSPAASTSHEASQYPYKDPIFKLMFRYVVCTYGYYCNEDFNKWLDSSNGRDQLEQYFGEITDAEKENIRKQALAVTVNQFFAVLEQAQELPEETRCVLTCNGFIGVVSVISGGVAALCAMFMFLGMAVEPSAPLATVVAGALTPVGVGLCCGIGLGIFFTLVMWLVKCWEQCTGGIETELWCVSEPIDTSLDLAQQVFRKLKNIDKKLGENAIRASQDKSFVETYSAKLSLFKFERKFPKPQNKSPERRHSFS